jgi:hypothetical protein
MRNGHLLHVEGMSYPNELRRLLRLAVFLYLESTAVRFNISRNGNKARNLSSENIALQFHNSKQKG